ncbi:MAG: hypothetical protein NT166_00625 [Candidatus Aminicenantes bacterium]|nr:hypothetical protein [Candidatus Aminicenantes bacterium]
MKDRTEEPRKSGRAEKDRRKEAKKRRREEKTRKILYPLPPLPTAIITTFSGIKGQGS